MSMYKQRETDPELERLGIILDFGDYRVRIARAGGKNKSFQKTMDRLAKPYRRAIDTETMDNDRAMDILRAGYAEAIILDWDALVGRDPDTDERIFAPGIEPAEIAGEFPTKEELLPVNKDNIILTLRNLPDVFADIQADAVKSALFRKTIQETESGN